MEKQGETKIKEATVVEAIRKAEPTRYESLPSYLKAVFIILSTIGMGSVVFFIFNLTIGGQPMLTHTYYYLLLGIFGACGYLVLPVNRKNPRIIWYDLVLAALVLAIPLYFLLHAWEIMYKGWLPPDTTNAILGLILCPLILELGRRVNAIYFFICLIIGLLPLYAGYLPGMFYGISLSWEETIGYLVFAGEGFVGLPMRAMGKYLIPFIMFAGVMVASGAGAFFLNVATAFLGRFRGGPAKVAVLGSGFFGMLSGSGISNIASTGSFTIPAMKRLGFPPHYAAAIEACASSGGGLMPPVMGAIAFIMAVLLDIPYGTIIVAAALPAFLYYWGMLIQVDALAAKLGLKGMPREELPSLKSTLRKGWVFIFVLVFLVWGLVWMQWEEKTPMYAMVLMMMLSFTNKETMLTPQKFYRLLAESGKLVTQTMAFLAPIAFITSGLLITGTAASLTAALVRMAGGNVFVLLLMGAVICYIFGMAGIVLAAYIFLAVTMAPALVEIAGLNLMAVHLFIVYWVSLAGITPPVAVGSFFAAVLAGSDPMRTSLTSMRIGIVIYFVPFFFVFNPSLLLQGPVLESLMWFVICLVGIFLLAEGMEGYLLKLGKLRLYQRALLIIGGLLFAYPEWKTTIIGAVLALVATGITLLRKRLAPAH